MSSNPSPNPSPSPEIIEAAAAAWLSLRDRGMTAAETTEFMRWLQQHPQHAAVFNELDGVWKDFDRLGVVPATAATDADLLAPRVRHRRHRTWVWSALGAAAAAAIAVGVFQTRAPRHTVATAIGAFQKFDLPDGSVAQLNTDSAIDTAFTTAERRVRIVRGEVFFNVMNDPARPFIVTSGSVAVRAVGTAFNVHRRDAAVEILVTEGRVRVDDARQGHSLLPSPGQTQEPSLLVAGERATVMQHASDAAPAFAIVVKVDAPERQRALAWRERRLEFDAAPLAEVVREFNRYNHRQLVIADAQLATKRFSGTFRADGYASFVGLLEESFGVAATETEGDIVLRAQR